MLVLSRKPGEKILIGYDIEVIIVDMQQGKVRIGINAPKDVPIYREEILLESVLNRFSRREEEGKYNCNHCGTIVDGVRGVKSHNCTKPQP